MDFKAYPGYEFHLNMYDILTNGTEEQKKEMGMTMQRFIRGYQLPEGMEMNDIVIEGPDRNELKLRIYRPAGLPEDAPIVMDIHGGGWISGDMDIDNYRCIYLAEHTPCLVVSVEYRLSNAEVHYPAPLMDCYAALNCPAVSLETFTSSWQNERFTLRSGAYNKCAEFTYIGEENFNGGKPSYYAMPAYCPCLSGVAPAYVVVAEYDTLRDDGIAYATKLLQDGVSTEMILAPGVGHGFCVCDLPLTRWVHNGMCASLRRRFGIDIWQGVLPSNNIKAISEKVGDRMLLMGGIDSVIDREDVTEEEVRTETRRALEEYGDLPGFWPGITYGAPGSIYPWIDPVIEEEIDKYNAAKFGM